MYWSSACGNFAHINVYTYDLLHVDTETLHIDVYMPVKMQKNNSPPCLSFLCTSPPVSLDIPLGHLALQQPSELRSGQAIRLAPNLSGAFAIMKNEPFQREAIQPFFQNLQLPGTPNKEVVEQVCLQAMRSRILFSVCSCLM